MYYFTKNKFHSHLFSKSARIICSYMSASKLRLRPISDWPRRMSDPTLDDIFSGHSRIKYKTYVQSKIGLEKSGESEIGLGHSQIEKFVRRI